MAFDGKSANSPGRKSVGQSLTMNAPVPGNFRGFGMVMLSHGSPGREHSMQIERKMKPFCKRKRECGPWDERFPYVSGSSPVGKSFYPEASL